METPNDYSDICNLCDIEKGTDICGDCLLDGECQEFELNPHATYKDLPRFDLINFMALYPPNLRDLTLAVSALDVGAFGKEG